MDIVERLNGASAGLCTENPKNYIARISVGDALEAADEITRLRARLAEAEADAWDEGYEAGWERGFDDTTDSAKEPPPNPYRSKP